MSILFDPVDLDRFGEAVSPSESAEGVDASETGRRQVSGL
jgi:hypothetical protein